MTHTTDNSTETSRTGGCACGAVRFNISAPLMGVGVCHCTDCQKASGGAPNYVALVPPTAFNITKGEPKVYVTQGDNDKKASRYFCSDCGTPLWSHPEQVTFIGTKLGAFDNNTDLAPGLHVYVSSAPSWHLMHDGLPQFPKLPPDPAA